MMNLQSLKSLRGILGEDGSALRKGGNEPLSVPFNSEGLWGLTDLVQCQAKNFESPKDRTNYGVRSHL